MAIAVAVVGLTPLVLAVVAGCVLAMTPAFMTLGRIERRSSRD